MKNGPYELIVAPENYPGKKYRGKYAYEHIVVWWKNTSHIPSNGEVIHHKDENKRNNKFKNLELKTVASHSREHIVPAKTKSAKCKNCGKVFVRHKRVLKSRLKINGGFVYCGRSCQVSAQQKARKIIAKQHEGRAESC